MIYKNINLKNLIKSNDEFIVIYTNILANYKKLYSYKNNININNLLSIIKKYENILANIELLNTYLFYKYIISKNDNDYNTYLKYKNIFNKIQSNLNFIEYEIQNLNSDLLSKIELQEYSKYINDVRNRKTKQIDSKKQSLIDSANLLPNKYYEYKNNNNFIGLINNEIELYTYNVSECLNNDDENIRKQAFDLYYDYLKKHNKEFSKFFLANFDIKKIEAKEKGYDSPMEMFLADENIDTKLIDILLESINENISTINEYFDIESMIIGDKYYDIQKYPTNNIDISPTDALQIFKDSMSILGDTYNKELDNLLNKDILLIGDNIGDSSNAIYLANSLAKVSYTNDLYSIGAISHELGHCMNDTLSKKNKPFLLAQSNVLLTEVIATINQEITLSYTLDVINNDNISTYEYFYMMFYTTIINQAIQLELANNIYKQNNLNTDDINNIYSAILKKYYKDHYSDKQKYDWINKTHLFYDLYSYQYIIGSLIAITIHDKLINDESFKNKYIKFISLGDSINTTEAFKILGIDIYSKEFYNNAFRLYGDKLKEFKYNLDNNKKKSID